MFHADPLHPNEIPGRGFPGAKDARPFEKQGEVRTFTSEVLGTPVEWTGKVHAELYVTSTAPDTDFIVRVSDIYPDGRSILLMDYVRRARYREGYEKEVLLEPGKVAKVAFDVGWTSQIFNRGHRIRITIASTGAPFYEPNPNTGFPLTIDAPKKTQVAHNSVQHHRRYASRVLAPVREQAEGLAPTQAEREQKVRSDLTSTQVEIRRAAILLLVHSDLSSRLREKIQEAFKDKDREVRSTAATATGNLGAAAAPAVPMLIALMKSDPSKEARETAARALGRIGKAAKDERRAVPPLRNVAAKDADPVTRVVALGALAMMEVDVPEQVISLRKYLHDESSLVRMKAAHALGMIGTPAKAAAPEIVTVLKRAHDAHQRGYIARALGNTADPASLPAIYKALKAETDPGARGEIQGAISRLGGKSPQKQ